MLRADVFTAGSLLRVSPSARLLAIALDAMAESTGVVKLDPDEIRSAVGFFLADAKRRPPTAEQVQRWAQELVDVGWALEYWRGTTRFLYLRGFGARQKGANVCIGVSQTTGEVEPYLPLPPCVHLLPHNEKTHDKAGHEVEVPLRKMLPHHCQETGACPCAGFANASPTQPEQVKRGKWSGPELEVDSEEEIIRGGGEHEGGLEAAVRRLSAEFGPEVAAKAFAEAEALARKHNPARRVDEALVRFQCEELSEKRGTLGSA